MATIDKAKRALRRMRKQCATDAGRACVDIAGLILEDPAAFGIPETASAETAARHWQNAARDWDKAAADGDIAAMVEAMEKKKRGNKALEAVKSGKLQAVR
jgi:hypothetical protein